MDVTLKMLMSTKRIKLYEGYKKARSNQKLFQKFFSKALKIIRYDFMNAEISAKMNKAMKSIYIFFRDELLD